MAMGGHERGEWPGKWYSMECCRHNKVTSAVCALFLGLLFMPVVFIASIFMAIFVPIIGTALGMLNFSLFLLRVAANIISMLFE